MPEYESVFSAAAELSIADRLRLIDDLAASVPDDQPPTLSDEWLAEIERRSTDLDAGIVTPEPWVDVRQRLFRKHGIGDAD
ncbi:MAG: addiction module protein [Planctomycetota bacterium]|nr:addiction module protein [Planctomycetota bacterium]